VQDSAVSVWTRPLRWSFIVLQIFGIYLGSLVLIALVVGAYFISSLVAIILGVPAPSYESVVRDTLLGQPLVIAATVAAVVASIGVTVGASRYRAWAHWAAMALIAISMVLAILLIVAFHDRIWLVIGLVYCVGGVAFLVAMTYASIEYGPWGMSRHAH
jgi:hypothetical protein